MPYNVTHQTQSCLGLDLYMKNRQHKPIMIKGIFKSLLVLWLMIITFTLTAEQQKKNYRVLILNSSTSHVTTSNKIINGIIDTLKQKSLTIDCYTEFLDSKSLKQTPELELLLLKYLNVKYLVIFSINNSIFPIKFFS